MRRTLIVLLVAVLAAACAKKQSPAAKSPAPDQAQDADKATGGAPDTEATPRSTSADPCEGGENK
jgi:hypothetical protein